MNSNCCPLHTRADPIGDSVTGVVPIGCEVLSESVAWTVIINCYLLCHHNHPVVKRLRVRRKTPSSYLRLLLRSLCISGLPAWDAPGAVTSLHRYKYIYYHSLTLSILYLLVSEIGRPFALLQIKSMIVVHNTHRAKIMIVNTTYWVYCFLTLYPLCVCVCVCVYTTE